MFGSYIGKAADEIAAKKIGRYEIKRGMNKGFEMLGSRGHGLRKFDQAAKISSGRRRAAVIGGAFALNAAIGPNGKRSTARQGIRPRSTGGYA